MDKIWQNWYFPAFHREFLQVSQCFFLTSSATHSDCGFQQPLGVHQPLQPGRPAVYQDWMQIWRSVVIPSSFHPQANLKRSKKLKYLLAAGPLPNLHLGLCDGRWCLPHSMTTSQPEYAGPRFSSTFQAKCISVLVVVPRLPYWLHKLTCS